MEKIYILKKEGQVIMSETRYIISDAAKKVDVEPHVLRYWEEELEMQIPRNEMGHRYYTDKEIHLLKHIRELKRAGFQLKAIKMLLPDLENTEHIDLDSLMMIREELNQRAEGNEEKTEAVVARKEAEVFVNEEKLAKLQLVMNKLVKNAMKEQNEAFSQSVSSRVTTSVVKEMDYLFRMNDEQQEQRYKLLDETIRQMQRVRAEVAATELEKKKKKGLFRRK